MNQPTAFPAIKLLVTIVDRGKSKAVAKLLLKHRLPAPFTCLGMGTATSEMLDYFGIGETKKDAIFSFVPQPVLPGLLRDIEYELQLRKPGKGIVFTVPLSGICRSAAKQMYCEIQKPENGVNQLENAKKHSLIMALVNLGHVDEVMDAAKQAGARGGTIIHGRSVGYEEAEKFFGISIQPEKEMVIIIAGQEQKQPIMQAISQAVGMHTPGKGLVFSLPVHDIIGLSLSEPPTE